VAAAEAISVADLNKTKRLAAEFEALGSGALTMALAQEAEPGDPLRECWLARERLCVSEARSINRAFILTARTDAAAEAAEASVTATAAEAAAAAAGAAAKAAADAPGAQAALASELPKLRGGGADGMAEDAEELPLGRASRPSTVFSLTAAGGKRRRWTWLRCWGIKAKATPRPSPSWASSS
jgi:hypothetical protein